MIKMNKKTLNTQAIPRTDNCNREHFQQHFYKPQKPVILTRYASNWPAMKKWTLDYFKQQHGDIEVPVYEDAFSDTGASYTNQDRKMPFAEYLDIIATKPSRLRMFLFNIFKHVPSLCDDFDYPDIIDDYLKKNPFMFFGGKTSHVDIHYDLDLSDLFLTQFDGRKRIILIEPKYSTHLYRHPLTVSCNVDMRNIDFTRYPAVEHVNAYECILERGETLYMPRGYWHFVEYLDGGFSLTLRALSKNPFIRAYSFWRIFLLTIVDRQVNNALGTKRWNNIKERIATKRANKLLKNTGK